MKVILVWIMINIAPPYGYVMKYTDMSDLASCEQYRHELEFTSSEAYIGGYCTEVEFPK